MYLDREVIENLRWAETVLDDETTIVSVLVHKKTGELYYAIFEDNGLYCIWSYEEEQFLYTELESKAEAKNILSEYLSE